MELSDRDLKVLLILGAIFVMVLTFANMASGMKLINLFGIIAPVGVIAYALTFPITDTIGEIYGRSISNLIVISGFISQVLLILMIYFGLYLPALSIDMQTLYSRALSLSPRIIVASLTAYLVSQTHDVFMYHHLGKIVSQHLWLRNNVSTMLSQLLDTIIFITIAFYGIFSNSEVISMIIGQYILKIIIAIVDTPLVYLMVNIVARYTGKSSVFKNTI